MPTYEYECDRCSETFQSFRMIEDRDRFIPCPWCELAGRRVIGRGVAVHFKGSGFYATDYAKGGR